MGDVEITLPKLPEPTPPAGFRVVGYEVAYSGVAEATGKGPNLKEARIALEREIGDCFKVFALASGKEDPTQTYDDAMVCEWMPVKAKWGEWEYS